MHTNTKQPNGEFANGEFNELLVFLKRTRGIDFTDYKATSLRRRITKRMQDVGCGDPGAYIDRLQEHPDEFTALLDTLLINVTGFFRDPDAWDLVRWKLIPFILANKESTDPIRVWTAACASGEETYTAAVLLADAVGDRAFSERVRIYATDLDEGALAQARQGIYRQRQLQEVPAEFRTRYFETVQDGIVTFRSDLRRSILFGRHDLVQDASISRLDLLICRNALMYFNAELQARILARFHFGLNSPGYLFLGRAEMLASRSELFEPIDIKHRIFVKVPKAGSAVRLTTAIATKHNQSHGSPIRPP